MNRRNYITSKAGILLFLALNLLVMVATLGTVYGGMAFLLSILAATSPLGETIIRRHYHVHRMTDEDQINRIEPIYHEILSKAGSIDPRIRDTIELCVTDEDHLQISAISQRTIAFSANAARRNEDEIRALMAHEIGHISRHDPLWITMAEACNLYILLIFAVLDAILSLIGMTVDAGRRGGRAAYSLGRAFGARGRGGGGLFTGLIMFVGRTLERILRTLRRFWRRLMQLLVNWSLREDELYADEFAFNLDCGRELRRIIERQRPAPEQYLERLLTPYVDPQHRLQHLNSLMYGTDGE